MKIVDRLIQSDFWKGRAGHPIEAIVVHITDGDSVDGAISWWRRPEVDASAHYVIDRDGTIYRVVDEENTAWSNGIVNLPDTGNPLIASWVRGGINPNRRTIGIELVGRPRQGVPAPQWEALVWLCADICRRRGIPPDRTHIIGHYQIDSVNRPNCPGFTGERWMTLISDVQRLLHPPSRRVGEGLRGALASAGDEAISDERYLKDERGDVISVVAGRNGLYIWHAEADVVYRVPRLDSR